MSDQRAMIRKSSAIITTAVGATPEVLYQQTTGGQNNRTVILRKILVYNDVGATTLDLGIGVGAGWAPQWPTLRLVNNMDNGWTEAEIPEVEVVADLTVQTDVAGVQVQVEVDEVGS